METLTMQFRLEKSWFQELQEELAKPYIAEIKAFLQEEERRHHVVYPPAPLIFQAFKSTPFEKVKVVIIGQDPYHGPGQAHGLSFSVPEGVPLPPSLRNIFQELHSDLGIPPSRNGCLLPWAEQGVLLLNATLTVRANEAKSHHGKGWERFTDAVVLRLIQRTDPLVFVLWGNSAKQKVTHFPQAQKSPHKILTAAHPSPLSAHNGFFGCRHFSQINTFLQKVGKAPIDWRV